jgi:hypothetical protein
MKRFLGCISLLALLTIGCLLLINNFCLHSNIYTNVIAKQDTMKFKNVPQQIKLGNVGNSHGEKDFCYENTELASFNFALESQSFIYDSNLLDFYQENIAEGAIILIPVSFFSLYEDELQRANFKSQNSRYYTFLDKEHIRNYDVEYNFLMQYCWLLTRSSENIVSDLLNSRHKIAPLQNWYDSAANMGKEELKAEGLTAWNRHWKDVSSHKDYQAREEDNIAALVKMIDLCRAKGAVPVLITTPFLNEYSQYYSKDFLDSFYGFINKFSDEHNVLYLDYAFDERFRNSPNLFINSDHLNREGALMFTDIVMKDLEMKL